MTDPSFEKRTAARVPFVLRVDYGPGRSIADVTENLSHGGLFVQTERSFKVGDLVPVSLSFPGLLDPVEIVGTVAWVRQSVGNAPGGVGLRVESSAGKQKLEQLLNMRGNQPEAPRPPPPGGYRVLIVEDNPHIVEMYSYVLKKLAANTLGGKVPFDVQFAGEGHAALKLLGELPFNLVMTDLYMPVLDGFALIERMREDEKLKAIPLIVISAGGKDAQERASRLGVDIFLRKPVKFVDVLETVKHLLHLA